MTGASELAKQEQRLAYILLLPTFMILLAIAVYPLSSVFVNSFTNNVFASSQPVEFVGLDNYVNLLSMTVKQVPGKIDEATGEPIIDEETGKQELESPGARPAPRDTPIQAGYHLLDLRQLLTYWAPPIPPSSARSGIR